MKCKKLKAMTLEQYKKWIENPESREASLPSFFPNGVNRTINVLKGTAKRKSVNKWKAFGARHYAAYCNKPTKKRRIALRNWGFNV